MVVNRLCSLTVLFCVVSFLFGCGGGGGSSKDNSSSQSSSSAESHEPLDALNQIDPEKHAAHIGLGVQYAEALVLLAHYAIDAGIKQESNILPLQLTCVGSGINPKQSSPSIRLISSAKLIKDFDVEFNDCENRNYQTTIDGVLTVEVVKWNRAQDKSAEITLNVDVDQLMYKFSSKDAVHLTGNFNITFNVTEDTYELSIGGVENFSFVAGSKTDFISSFLYSHNINYVEASHTVSISEVVNSARLESLFELETEVPFSGKVGHMPDSGSLVASGYFNTIRLSTARSGEQRPYLLAFDLANANNFVTYDQEFMWESISNLSLFWDRAFPKTLLNMSTGNASLQVYPVDYQMADWQREDYGIGVPGDEGYSNVLYKDQPYIIYRFDTVNASEVQAVEMKMRNENHVPEDIYIFNLQIDGAKLKLIPPADLPLDKWYFGRYTVTDEAGFTVIHIADLLYKSSSSSE